MDAVVIIIAGPLFLVSIAGYIYVKLFLSPKEETEPDEYYYEFEDKHPGLARYNKWSKITFAVAALSVLLMLLSTVF